MDTHYYPINLVPHGVLCRWFFILWQQIDWRMLSSLFVFPGVPCDGVRARYRAQGERWDPRKDHSVWTEAKFTSTFFTCSCLHYTVPIPRKQDIIQHWPITWAVSKVFMYLKVFNACKTLTINSHCPSSIPSSTWVQSQICKYVETPTETCYGSIRKLSRHLN